MAIFLLFILSCFILMALIVFVILAFFKITEIFFTDAPFIPITNKIMDNVIENLQLTDKSVLYDLGCGDARILRRAVELKPDIDAVGIEISYLPYFLAKFFTRKNKKINIRRENIFKTNISDATHIFLYLYPKAVNKLIYNIKTQCVPGTRIVSCDFEIKSCKPLDIVYLENERSKICKKLFIYSL
jgi:hypothetical protein